MRTSRVPETAITHAGKRLEMRFSINGIAREYGVRESTFHRSRGSGPG